MPYLPHLIIKFQLLSLSLAQFSLMSSHHLHFIRSYLNQFWTRRRRRGGKKKEKTSCMGTHHRRLVFYYNSRYLSNVKLKRSLRMLQLYYKVIKISPREFPSRCDTTFSSSLRARWNAAIFFFNLKIHENSRFISHSINLLPNINFASLLSKFL